MGVAARVAGWQRRLGGQAGPLGAVSAGSGDSPNGAVLQVELFVGGVWTDITSYVMTRDGSGHVSISRGQPDEGSNTDPGRCSFQLNNRDGRFSPRNPLSPYFGQLGRNQPIRVSVPSGLDKSYRFWGEVSSWPQRWDITGTDVWVDLESAGILRRLGQGSAPAGSSLYLGLTSGDIGNPVIAYWPCEDKSGSTSVASAVSGVAPMVVAGTPTFESFSGFVCSDPLPVMADGSFTGTMPSYSAPSDLDVNFLLSVPTGGATDQQAVCTIRTTGTIPTWRIFYESGSGAVLSINGLDTLGNVVADPGSSVGTIDGKLNQINVSFSQSGSTLTYQLAALEVGQGSATLAQGTATAQFGTITQIVLAQDRGLTDSTIGQLWVQQTDDDFFFTRDAITANTGERAGHRLTRLSRIAGIPYQQIGSDSDTVFMGAELNSTLLALLTDCSFADMGLLNEQTGNLGLTYRTRVDLENQAAALALSYSSFNLSEVPEPIDDDQHTRNDVTVSRPSGSSVRSTLTTGSMSVNQPPAGVGRYDEAVTANVELDIDLRDQAGWRMHLGTVDEARFPTISVNLAHPTFTSTPSLRNQVLAVRPGDRITISSPPPWLPPDDISQIVLGFTEQIDNFQHVITFNCAPESPYRTALLDSATQGRLDTGGSQLDQSAAAADTTLVVATTSGPVWTTTDVPFDVMVSGERITVNSVTGATSPQSFGVTRSVNGVAKALQAGADVRLYQPMIIGM